MKLKASEAVFISTLDLFLLISIISIATRETVSTPLETGRPEAAVAAPTAVGGRSLTRSTPHLQGRN